MVPEVPPQSDESQVVGNVKHIGQHDKYRLGPHANFPSM